MNRSRIQPLRVMTGAALLEMRRRRDLGILGLLGILGILFLAVAARIGFEHAAAATLLLNLCMTLAINGALLVALVVAGRQFPDEFERRTLQPMLARPVRRDDLVVAKWAAGSLAGILVYGVLVIPPLLLIPRMEFYSSGTLAQGCLLHPLSLAMTAAWATACSLYLPRWPSLAVAALMVFGSNALWRATGQCPLLLLLPDPGRLDLTLRYTDGIAPLPVTDLARLAAYGMLWTLLALTAAMSVFRRKAL